MALPASFQSMTSSVLPSQEREVLIAKQAALANHGQETRLALNRLPPSVVDEMMASYREPSPQTLDALAVAIAEREQVIESAEKGQNLDMEWLSSNGVALGRHMDETGLGADDPWNDGPSI